MEKILIKKLESLSTPEAVAGMARFGINPKNTYGVSIPILRKMAKEPVKIIHSPRNFGTQVSMKPGFLRA
jgi:3-methyladenine DNA glycosylase AlkD